MDSVYDSKHDCCGCGACAALCPVHAIQMVEDERGFRYPQIKQDVCTNCVACRRACPFLHAEASKNAEEPAFYAAYHRDALVLANSTSGGAFTALSDAILAQNGVIYGAVFDEAFEILHTRAETAAERDRMRISKYAQSRIDTAVYKAIRRDLQQGRKVLFTGTPCQTAGVRAYLGYGKLTETLVLCDLICHSITSPRFWRDYLARLAQKHKSPVTEVFFRTKLDGWCRMNSNKGLRYRVSNCGTLHSDDTFYKLFGSGHIGRPACERCPFTTLHRTGDLTIADYWGIEKYTHAYDGISGVSVILVSTKCGESLLQSASADLHLERRNKAEQLAELQRLSSPVVLPQDYESFWQSYPQASFTE